MPTYHNNDCNTVKVDVLYNVSLTIPTNIKLVPLLSMYHEDALLIEHT